MLRKKRAKIFFKKERNAKKKKALKYLLKEVLRKKRAKIFFKRSAKKKKKS